MAKDSDKIEVAHVTVTSRKGLLTGHDGVVVVLKDGRTAAGTSLSGKAAAIADAISKAIRK